MLDKTLEQLAERILSLDEASLTQLLPQYKKVMEQFEPTKEWEKSVIIFFLINSVRVKNSLFNENIMKGKHEKAKKKKGRSLKLVKP
ncbi:MAG: hypothetical protein JRG97_02770 [Deltaproteobacteria bacterium]|nr:hypothetical protein [Deltaproteobacteria bacterium]MBW2051693.1 hypothetical protein [Deltaproteobacteria bacterium]MBW2139979.1 hypothetical protein [Deltaproteobacteria bacterium]MBW2322313.1 hypothetical protein [Deltaproteobacteria bacterium]